VPYYDGSVPQKPLGFHDSFAEALPPCMWEEYEGIEKVETDNNCDMIWGNRRA